MNQPQNQPRPSWRKPVGALGLVAMAFVWTISVANLSGWVSTWPVLVQALFYLVAGIGWIFPAMPLLRWMETGRWRA